MAREYLKPGDEVVMYGVVGVVEEDGELGLSYPITFECEVAIRHRATQGDVLIDADDRPYNSPFNVENWQKDVADHRTLLGYNDWLQYHRIRGDLE